MADPQLVRVERSGAQLADRLRVADGWWSRLRGLLARRSLPAGDGIHLVPGSSIHTHFMLFAIDVVYLDGDGHVVKLVHGLKPWRFSAARGARSVIEVPAGSLAGLDIEIGDRILFEAAAQVPA